MKLVKIGNNRLYFSEDQKKQQVKVKFTCSGPCKKLFWNCMKWCIDNPESRTQEDVSAYFEHKNTIEVVDYMDACFWISPSDVQSFIGEYYPEYQS